MMLHLLVALWWRLMIEGGRLLILFSPSTWLRQGGPLLAKNGFLAFIVLNAFFLAVLRMALDLPLQVAVFNGIGFVVVASVLIPLAGRAAFIGFCLISSAADFLAVMAIVVLPFADPLVVRKVFSVLEAISILALFLRTRSRSS